MLLYHGTPIGLISALMQLKGHRFCVPFPRPDNLFRCSEIGAGMMLDNGAFSVWRRGLVPEWPAFYAWVEPLLSPEVWAVIPDVIVGDEAMNDALLAEWPHGARGAPVWHMHEDIGRLLRLIEVWPRVCVGSSERYAVVLSASWQSRMDEVWNAIWATFGQAPNLHMLRGINLAGRRWPFGSADSTDIARNHNRPQNDPLAMALRWEHRAARTATAWHPRPVQQELFAA